MRSLGCSLRLVAALAAAPRSRRTNSARTSADTLTIYAQSGDRIPFEAALKIWKKQNPNVKVQRHLRRHERRTRARCARSSPPAPRPDVFEVWPGNGNPAAIQVLAPYRYLADLSSQPFAKREPAGLKVVTHVNGKLYFVPPAFSGIGAIYNMDTLGKIGAQAPTTWSQVLALCDQGEGRRDRGVRARHPGLLGDAAHPVRVRPDARVPHRPELRAAGEGREGELRQVRLGDRREPVRRR